MAAAVTTTTTATTTAAGSHAMADRVLMVLATLLSGVAIAALDLLWQAAP